MNDLIPIAIFISFLWGMSSILEKYVLKSINVPTLLVINAIVYMICMVIYYIIKRKDIHISKALSKCESKTLSILILNVVFALFVANILYFEILSKHKSYIVTALVFSAPLFTVLFGCLLLKEKITVTGFMGLIFIVLGVICISLKDE